MQCTSTTGSTTRVQAKFMLMCGRTLLCKIWSQRSACHRCSTVGLCSSWHVGTGRLAKGPKPDLLMESPEQGMLSQICALRAPLTRGLPKDPRQPSQVCIFCDDDSLFTRLPSQLNSCNADLQPLVVIMPHLNVTMTSSWKDVRGALRQF